MSRMPVKRLELDDCQDLASFQLIAGIDEAGRGPLAGPVVAAAVVFTRETRFEGVNDSKQLTIKQRESLYEIIITQAQFAIGIASASEIDTLNILHASMLAMSRAASALACKPDIALIDGNRCPKLTFPTRAIVDGDARHSAIAAASIIAKVTRDRLMRELAQEYPGYGWERNAGYGTGEHQHAMVHLGITPHHRRSFAPVRALLEVTDLFSYAG